MMKPLTLLLLAAAAARAEARPAKCAQIYYDAAPQAPAPYTFGRVHAIFLQNLLGHFPDVQQIVSPIGDYQSGQLGRCATSFYLGTYFDNRIPQAFLDDFAASTRTAVWAGYNVWKLPAPELERLWGVRFRGLSTLDAERKDELGRPTFFKLFDYKGQVFEKYGEPDAAKPERFNAAYEISLFDLVSPAAKSNVKAWARHNGRPELRAPYVLARAGRWYVGDSPFAFITEEDRYLIFADLLFDMLQEPPRRPPGARKPALFRVEDVSPALPPWELYGMVDLLAGARAPFSVALIPIWTDALGILKSGRNYRLADLDAGFVDFLRYAAARRASFILHGVTHQYGFSRNPFSGISGDDFEFWDRKANRPVARDGARFALDRLKDGLDVLKRAGVVPVAWETPHYQASPLDYLIFARRFSWNVGRVVYFPFTASRPAGDSLDGLTASYPDGLLPAGQFYPYEIFGDLYGQRVIPENVGNVQPYMNEQVLKSITIDDMIRIMRRNAALRDAWASFFVHPSMLDTAARGGTARRPGDGAQLARLIRAARGFGYEFVDLSAWTARAGSALRPESIEVKP